MSAPRHTLLPVIVVIGLISLGCGRLAPALLKDAEVVGAKTLAREAEEAGARALAREAGEAGASGAVKAGEGAVRAAMPALRKRLGRLVRDELEAQLESWLIDQAVSALDRPELEGVWTSEGVMGVIAPGWSDAEGYSGDIPATAPFKSSTRRTYFGGGIYTLETVSIVAFPEDGEPEPLGLWEVSVEVWAGSRVCTFWLEAQGVGKPEYGQVDFLTRSVAGKVGTSSCATVVSASQEQLVVTDSGGSRTGQRVGPL